MSATEPSSVILSQKVVSKIGKECPNITETKRNGVINPHHYNFDTFNTEKFDALKRYK